MPIPPKTKVGDILKSKKDSIKNALDVLLLNTEINAHFVSALVP